MSNNDVNVVEDLDKFVPQDRKVRLFGEEYLIPGDVPMEAYLRVQNATTWTREDARLADLGELPDNRQEGARGPALVDAIADLFVCRLPEAARPEAKAALEKKLMGLGMRTLAGFLSQVYQRSDDESAPDEPVVVEDADALPPPSGPTGMTSTTPSAEPAEPPAS